jgi:hypothetical protein
VEGRRVPIHTTTTAATTGDGNVDCVHGVLEELIAVDTGPGPGEPGGPAATSSDDPDALPSPRTSQRDEVVSLLLDAVWPEVVDAVRPLVHAVGRVCRERGITYEDVEDDEDADAGGGGGGGWVESDDDL